MVWKGMTVFHAWGSRSLMEWSSASDLVALGGGRLIAVTRYQTRNSSQSPTFNAPTIGRATGPRYQGTAVLTSTDSGRSWFTQGLITGFAQQTASLANLGQGTLAVVFSHMDSAAGVRFGQRAMFSYDKGLTFSNAILELHHGGMYASSVVLPDGVIVSVYGDANHSLGAIRWRPPPTSNITAYGSFRPLAIQTPMPAPPPPGFPLPVSPFPLPPVPDHDPASAYGPECGAGKIPGDGRAGEFNCIWATYDPILRPWAPLSQRNHSLKGFIEPTLARGRGLTGTDVLLVESSSVVYTSADGGETFVPVCAMPRSLPAAAKEGFPNGLGLLSDGTLLAARTYSHTTTAAAATASGAAGGAAGGVAGGSGTTQLEPLTTTGTRVYRGTLPLPRHQQHQQHQQHTAGAAGSAGGTGGNLGLGDCKWSAGVELAPLVNPLNSVGGGLGMRFTEQPPSSTHVRPAAEATVVLIAVRNTLGFTRSGAPLPPAAHQAKAVIYRFVHRAKPHTHTYARAMCTLTQCWRAVYRLCLQIETTFTPTSFMRWRDHGAAI